MPNQATRNGIVQWAHLGFALLLAAGFFLPWVQWDSNPVKGTALAGGDFFRISEEEYTLGNPFPQFSFSFYVFWLIPVLAIAAGVLAYMGRKGSLLAYLSGALALTQLTIFLLFTRFLFPHQSLTSLVKIGGWLTLFGATGLLITSIPLKAWIPKLVFLCIGPVIAYAGYKIGEKVVMSETNKDTADIKADYYVKADDLLTEFLANDSLANKKYLDKVLVVTGKAGAVDLLPDSTSTIRFADQTGSYAIFSFEKDQYEKTKLLKEGDALTIKGVCSGSIFSDILKITTISFKRSTFNTTK